MTDRLTPYQQKLVADNADLARYLAMYSWSRDFEGRDGDEAVSVAFMGLMSAARNFDPSRPEIDEQDLKNGKAFSGYARVRINGALKDWFKSRDHVSRNTRKTYRDLQRAGHGSGMDLDTVLETTGVEETTARRIIAEVEAPPVLFDSSPAAHEVEASVAAVLLGPQNVESDTITNSLLRSFADAWAKLPFEERAAVANRVYFGHTLAETGKAVGAPARRARILVDESVEYLTHIMRNHVKETR